MKKIINHLKESWIKYILEIVVITLNILAAVSMDNWNENRKMINEEGKYLQRIYSDLKVDSSYFSNYKDYSPLLP